MLDLKRVLASIPKKIGDETPRRLTTPWGDEVAATAAEALARGDAKATVKTYVPRPEHPHPQFERTAGRWQSLNGWWECAFSSRAYNPEADIQEWLIKSPRPRDNAFAPILVPFSPEAPLSGVERQLQPNELLWYRRTLKAPATAAGERVFLRFEGVDDTCAVWVNSSLAGTHQGAYLPFAFDVTELLAETSDGISEITVCVADPSDKGVQLRGKQRLERGNIWYTAQSGIWQPVWLEVVPAARIERVCITPDARTGRVAIEADVTGEGTLRVTASAEGKPQVTGESVAADGLARVELSFDDISLWYPDHPFLYDLELAFDETNDLSLCLIDTVRSYFAFRTCNAERGRFWLNDHVLFLRGVLSQGYWPDGLMTAPTDDAFAADILAMKAAGFNMLREHIKIESDRFYWLCDKLGMLVWQDMVSGGSPAKPLRTMTLPTLFTRSWWHYSDTTPTHWLSLGARTPRYRKLWRDTCEATVRYLANHPCIVTWVLFNEGWGQFASESAVALVRRQDRTRPIQAVSGWYDNGTGDYCGAHNYFRPPQVFRDPFDGKLPWGTCVKRGPRVCVTDEFGGIVHNVEGHAQLSTSYGYDVRETREDYAAAVRELLAQMDALEADGLAGYVYTQVSDVEEETNGILTYDRRVNKLEDEA